MYTLKINNNGECRRFQAQLGNDGVNYSYKSLKMAVRDSFPELRENKTAFCFMYKDDIGDVVTISSDLEFTESIRIMKSEMKLNILKYTLKYLEGSEDFWSCRNGPISSPPKKVTPSGSGIICAECHVSIPFIYYKCSVRENYCMCTACYEMKRQPYTVQVRYVNYDYPEVSIGEVEHVHLDSIPEAEVELAPSPISIKNNLYENIVHCGVTCDRCGQFPIQGLRFKCSVRDDFDLCLTCFNVEVQPHPMLVITAPIKYSLEEETVVERETQTEVKESIDEQTETTQSVKIETSTNTLENCKLEMSTNTEESCKIESFTNTEESIKLESSTNTEEGDGSRLSFLQGCFKDSWVTSILEPSTIENKSTPVAEQVNDDEVDDIYSDYYLIDDMILSGGSDTPGNLNTSNYQPDVVEGEDTIPVTVCESVAVAPCSISMERSPIVLPPEEELIDTHVTPVPNESEIVQETVDEAVPPIILWYRQLLMLSEMGFKDTEECIELLQEHVGTPADNANDEREVLGMQRVVARLIMRAN